MAEKKLKHFYIAEDQSIYLLSSKDAAKLKKWMELCIKQLNRLGYSNVEMIGKGAYGFVFEGEDDNNQPQVFKFSRLDLPLHVQDRLEEEAQMQDALSHAAIPRLYEYLKIKRQSIIHMSRAKGEDLEVISLKQGPLPAEQIVNITILMIELLTYIADPKHNRMLKPVVHGDIKPSNIVWDDAKQSLQLIDWGSSVWAQLDKQGNSTATNVMDLMSSDIQQTNSRMGDIYFIGEEQLNGGLSSPRFDEQGMAATIYALASGQSCRYGYKVITASSLGLPQILAKPIDAMLGDDPVLRRQAGDYLFNNLGMLKKLVLSDTPTKPAVEPLIPVWLRHHEEDIETVVYGSRKSFLREQGSEQSLYDVDDVQLEKYYKNYLAGMGATEKAFIAAVSRLAKYPVVGGLAVRWEKDGVYVDSNITLYDPSLEYSFQAAVNNMIYLAQGIYRVGIFKSCLFNAKDTLHFERDTRTAPFENNGQRIPFEVSAITDLENVSHLHSYFEDGKDPDEYLHLPDNVMLVLKEMNSIHHTGCIIFEVLEQHLKIHSYLMLLDHSKKQQFEQCLQQLLELLPSIDELGIAGFMKLPYKDTRFFEHINQLPEHYYPKNPK
ncbi:serine/threonine protein kinase [Thalassotalea sp. HSM 43]|uniref:protein kinase domain-containing protein n=1 Tax=Thalassotalea sp. HSM 43 TaxID=2552945 RepID=UPI001081F8CA|nr:serine/threonine protein kinase [Thalassotalea sp. HSM 43]QBY05727.1 serine/threonine protein kinase [Thalassotalea sp. HSM 43]